ncbi:MAG: RNA polymerase factor sigma-54 [Paracoccaceae bacterium]|nr:RNA polymerase factor sigma-54 [Paracoccaceae bacterium]MDE3238644.1 RNA polymerase factor sigma-54 [Paracoccaceae bacterium]
MSLRPSLSPALRQKHALTPGLQYGLRILQMTAPDLIAEVLREADDNPFLHVDSGFHRAGERFAFDTLEARPSLGESLRRQIGTMQLSPEVRALAEYLTGELRDDGYLDATVEEVARDTDSPRSRVEEALEALQRCEPTGVGARDLAECLALQLGDHGYSRETARRIVGLLPLFAERSWRNLSRLLGMSPDELQQIAATLKRLTPHPVTLDSQPAPPLTADLIVTRNDSGALAVALNPAALPRIDLDAALVRSVGKSGEPQLAERRDRARGLVAALEARGRTLLRIGQRLTEDQAGFFAHGPLALRPKTRQDLASDLALHPATVSRALAGKALLFEGRLHPLGMFFSSALPGPDGEAVSARAVQASIRRMIDEEPPEAPLSDARICQRLRESGVDISRRTVAKYRGWMRIPTSSKRRRR